MEFPRWITVKVTDDANNTTEEEVSIEGLEEVPREGAPTGADTTAPTISFSGSAVEALETGATSGRFELRMFAKDGTPTSPQSGIAKVEIGIDGTMLQSWEKYCPVGSCRLKQQWTYSPANYSASGHVMTIIVHDHAGNVTTRTIGPDKTPPTVELSGPLTEGLKEGTTSYPLHVHATDGSPEFPGSGVKRISISVDGAVVKTVEQTCVSGSCPMDTDWDYETTRYPGEHEIEISATDFAGNGRSEGLPITTPDGAFPACTPLGGETEGVPTKVTALPGGGLDYIYEGAEGGRIDFPQPPSTFSPLTASNEELEIYGFEPKPSQPRPAKRWEREMANFHGVAPPGGCVQAGLLAGSEGTMGITSPSLSSWTLQQPESGTETFLRARFNFEQPKTTPGVCPNEASNGIWTGIGTSEKKGFFQAGTTVVAQSGKPYAFAQMLYAKGHKRRSEEKIIHLKVPVKEGQEVAATVEWQPGPERARMFVKNVNTGVTRPAFSERKSTYLYDGDKVEFTSAERVERVEHRATGDIHKLLELAKFAPFEMTGAEVFNSSHNWLTPAEVVPRFLKKMGSGGTLMAEPSPLKADGQSFSNQWLHCHP